MDGDSSFGSTDILIGDHLNIDALTWTIGSAAVKGSSYDNAVDGLRAYLKAIDSSSHGSDSEVIAYVRGHYTELMDNQTQGGNDILAAGADNDIIIGNAGNDTLIGGTGNDIFVFAANSNSGQDHITDFIKGHDKIVFSDLVDTSKLIWETNTHTLKFTGVQDGHTYENSIIVDSASLDIKLEDLIGQIG